MQWPELQEQELQTHLERTFAQKTIGWHDQIVNFFKRPLYFTAFF